MYQTPVEEYLAEY